MGGRREHALTQARSQRHRLEHKGETTFSCVMAALDAFAVRGPS